MVCGAAVVNGCVCVPEYRKLLDARPFLLLCSVRSSRRTRIRERRERDRGRRRRTGGGKSAAAASARSFLLLLLALLAILLLLYSCCSWRRTKKRKKKNSCWLLILHHPLSILPSHVDSSLPFTIHSPTEGYI